VWADAKRVQRVVLDLALSARDATPDGGHITIRTADAGEFVLLEISDSGGAQRAERMGLGLATVFGVVEQSGGTIEVESKPGSGTTVRVLLPRVAAAVAAPAAA